MMREISNAMTTTERMVPAMIQPMKVKVMFVPAAS